jgi:hypothetical protein
MNRFIPKNHKIDGMAQGISSWQFFQKSDFLYDLELREIE